MKEILCQIELGGVLGKKFGKVHERLIMKTGEATLSLAKTIPGFENFMLTSKERGLTFAVFRGKKNINEDDLGMPVTGDVIKIVPLIIGSKKAGLFQTILGVALVAVGAILSFTPAAAASPYLMQFGAAMALGGIVQMLSPQPRGLASKQDSDNKASYAFGGATNTTAQGNPVAILYGRRRIGGAVISAGIYVEDQQ